MTTTAKTSITVDEVGNLPRGLWIWHYGDFHLDSETTPLPSMLAAMPVALTESARFSQKPDPALSAFIVGPQFMVDNAGRYEHDYAMARMITVLVLLGTCAATWAFARSLYGRLGALVALLVVAFSPEMLAHGTLVTADMYLAAAFVCSLWAFDALLRRPGASGACVLGVAMGAASLCKLTGVLLVALLPISLLLILLLQRLGVRDEADRERLPVGPRTIAWVTVAVVVAVVVINLGYGNVGTSFRLLRDYTFDSPMLARVHAVLPGWLPVPLPFDFVKGADLQFTKGTYEAYLLGTFNKTGFWNYYLVGMLVKTPEPVVLLGLAATVLWRRVGLREVPTLVVGIGCFAFISFVTRKNIGMRYVLFAVPLIAIWIGRIAAAPIWARWPRLVGGGVTLACGSLVLTTALTWPHYLAYFNTASGGPDNGHSYLLDSNLDWGQDLITLRDYMHREGISEIDFAYFGRVDPELIYGIKYRPMWSGIKNRYIVISSNFLWGLGYWVYGTPNWMANRDHFAELRSKRPVAILGHSLYVYDLLRSQ